MHAIDQEASQQLRSRRTELLQLGALVLLFLAIGTWTIGWVVRGFLGIPRGMDRRPEARPESPVATANDGLR